MESHETKNNLQSILLNWKKYLEQTIDNFSSVCHGTAPFLVTTR